MKTTVCSRSASPGRWPICSADESSSTTHLLDPVPVEGKFGAGEGKLWAELLSAKDSDTEVLERYGKSNGWLDGQPAAITRKVGKGRITYIGAWLDDAAMSAAAKWMADISGVKPALGKVPEGVEVYPRYSEHGVLSTSW